MLEISSIGHLLTLEGRQYIQVVLWGSRRIIGRWTVAEFTWPALCAYVGHVGSYRDGCYLA